MSAGNIERISIFRGGNKKFKKDFKSGAVKGGHY